MDDQQWYAEQFLQHRPRLRAVASRMLGSATDAEDALQEAWIRSRTADGAAIADVEGWLVTVVGRACIDMLRARSARPEIPSGSLPEPVATTERGRHPEAVALAADSVGQALLVVLGTLTPAERLAFVLHDMFRVPFDDIAPLVDRSPAATRQLASRARRRVQGRPTAPAPDLNTQRRLVDAFLAATRAADFEELLRLLDPDVVYRLDAGTRAGIAPARLTGASAVAERLAANGFRYAALCRPALVDGAPGIVARTSSRILAVVGMTIVDQRITEIDLVLDASRLSHVEVRPLEGTSRA